MLLDKCHFFRVLPINISTRLIDMSDQSFNRNCHIIKLVSFSNESMILLTILLFLGVLHRSSMYVILTMILFNHRICAILRVLLCSFQCSLSVLEKAYEVKKRKGFLFIFVLPSISKHGIRGINSTLGALNTFNGLKIDFTAAIKLSLD